MNDSELLPLIAAIDQLIVATEESSTLNPEALQHQRRLLEQVGTYLKSQQTSATSLPALDAPEALSQERLTLMISEAIAQGNRDWSNAIETVEQRLAVLSRERQSLLEQLQNLEVQQQQVVQDFVQDFSGRLEQGGQQRITQLAADLAARMLALPLSSPFAATTDAPTIPTGDDEAAIAAIPSTPSSSPVWQRGESTANEDALSTELANAETQLTQNSLDDEPPLILTERPTLVTQASVSQTATTTSAAEIDLPTASDTIQLLTDLIPADPEANAALHLTTWYLGLDFGSTGLSAVLLDTQNARYYPIGWQSGNASETSPDTHPLQFRLPALAYFDWRGDDPHNKQPIFVVGAEAAELAQQQTGLFLDNFKPYLNLAVPYYDEDQQTWEPTLSGSEQQTVSLRWVQQALQTLLATLKTADREATAAWKVEAVGLAQPFFQEVLQHLAGVICTLPTHWGDTYRFNVREALLQVQLIAEPDKIFFVEETIATLCSRLPWQEALDTSQSLVADSQSSLPTLTLSVGALATELAFVDLPRNAQTLNHDDFYLASLAYGGYALDQDIFIHLLYPQWRSQLQPHVLELESGLPRPGHPDEKQRERVAQRLQRSAVGRSFLAAARQLKQILQHQSEYQAQFRGQPWQVKRQDLIHLIVRPFLYQLNQDLNTLLRQAGQSEQAIAQVVCSGGSMAVLWQTLSGWLSQKFPNAALVAHPQQPHDATPVAIGLGRIALFPGLIERDRHQYSDYFLLHELLQVVPKEPFTFEAIVQLLRQRGINTRVCAARILALLNGRLPTGLEDIPLSSTSAEWSPRTATASITLFSQTENGRYYANLQPCQDCRDRLAAILSHAQQQLNEPLLAQLS